MPIHAQPEYWVLETDTTAYAFGLNPAGRLAHAYWGPRLPRLGDYPTPPNPQNWASFNAPGQLTPEEYPVYGGMQFVEPCLKLTFADGVRDCVLRFVSFDVCEDSTSPELILHLQDAAYPLQVALHYRLHEKYDLIERWAVLTNLGDQPMTLERAFSAQWHLPPAVEPYRLSHLTGRWMDEWHVRQEPLVHGVKVLESRRLTTSHHHNPWFAVDRGQASEDQGEVWFGVLAWSGNWKLAAEVTDFGSTRLSLGLNDWDFAWRLTPGEAFPTPSSLAGYTPGGFGAASRHLHDYIRQQVLPHGPIEHKVLYNSWEATLFAVDEPSQAKLAEIAAAMGVELFVMDDGWFHKRNWDNAGLGDWWPDAQKFPNGLRPLIEKVNALGMEFGLWLEPEMVNPDSDLYRQHPDWVIHFPTRERSLARTQLILNLGRKDVQAYLIETLDRLLSESNIAFIKWDMNRNVSEPGWPEAGRSETAEARELWVRYVQGVYHVWETLARRHPQVIWQSCSGGGGRADLGILRLADQIWVSDNTEPTARLGIQAGFSHVFPAAVMEAWVTDMGPTTFPLKFRFHVSMCGSLGVGGNLFQWSERERETAAKLIAQYKEIRPIIQLGDAYRLLSPQSGAFSAVEYVHKDRSEAVLFVFRTHLPEPALLPPVYLRGLDPDALYEVEGFPGQRSGLAWMSLPLQFELKDFQSTLRRIKRIEQNL